jgi:uncharacterized protein (DUF433 family)
MTVGKVVANHWDKNPSVGRTTLGCGLETRLPGRFLGTITSMLDWSQCSAVERHPHRVSGAWVFRGTRVPVKALFENLESGARLEEFLEWFPGVSREQAEAVLEHAASSLLVA